jgi:argonaute-like protein implicated in RNA metabolism and viral defense
VIARCNREESIFSPFNKKETTVLEQFLTEVATTSKLPKTLSEDAHRLLKLLKAETDNVSTVRAALEIVSQHQIHVVLIALFF